MSGLIAWIIGCAITGALIGFIWGKVSKARKRKKMFAVESTPGTGYTPKQPNALTHPELSKLVKGKDKITWCGKEYWYYGVGVEYVWLILIDPEKYPDWQMHARVKADDLEALLRANAIQAKSEHMAKPIIDQAAQTVKDIKEFREWKANKDKHYIINIVKDIDSILDGLKKNKRKGKK